jgi:hypothetical protein
LLDKKEGREERRKEGRKERRKEGGKEGGREEGKEMAQTNSIHRGTLRWWWAGSLFYTNVHLVPANYPERIPCSLLGFEPEKLPYLF